jgi:RNA polymerase sigma-70 factor (ECF subfamily)
MARSEPAQKARLADSRVDERLLIEAAQKDRACFAEVYEKYFELVYGYVARRTRDRAKAEDLTSEVFRKALQNLSRFKWTGAPFGAWLLRIAANLIADKLKREAREQNRPVSVDEIAAQGGGNPSTPSSGTAETQQQELEECERRARLFKLVDELAEDQRRVVVMRFAEDKSIKQIASNLGRSEGAVKQLQFRALENLRKMFTGETQI